MSVVSSYFLLLFFFRRSLSLMYIFLPTTSLNLFSSVAFISVTSRIFVFFLHLYPSFHKPFLLSSYFGFQPFPYFVLLSSDFYHFFLLFLLCFPKSVISIFFLFFSLMVSLSLTFLFFSNGLYFIPSFVLLYNGILLSSAFLYPMIPYVPFLLFFSSTCGFPLFPVFCLLAGGIQLLSPAFPSISSTWTLFTDFSPLGAAWLSVYHSLFSVRDDFLYYKAQIVGSQRS